VPDPGPAPRISPLPQDEHDEQTRELLAGVRIAGAPDAPAANIFSTLVRHPGLFRHWLRFAGKLLSGQLPARDRELLILRTGWLCRAAYEWGQHKVIARAAGIPAVTLDHRDFADRAAFEAVLQSALDQHRIDLICLAGFMRLFTAGFVQRWHGRMLNIHPSLLPSFPGLEPHAQALRAGVKISGATVHFVIPETDAGPILMQGAVAVRDDDTPETLAERILGLEHRIYPEALRLVAGGRIRLEGDVCKAAGSAGRDDSLVSPAVT